MAAGFLMFPTHCYQETLHSQTYSTKTHSFQEPLLRKTHSSPLAVLGSPSPSLGEELGLCYFPV